MTSETAGQTISRVYLTPERIDGCRICGSTSFTPVIDLGMVALNEFASPGNHVVSKVAPLKLVQCDPSRDGCSLVQLNHKSLPPDDLYAQYWYMSGTNESMVTSLANVSESAVRYIGGVSAGDVVVDIGANDGTLLGTYGAQVYKLAFEPSNLAARACVIADETVHDVFSRAGFEASAAKSKATIVTSIAMFYDLDDPIGFARDVAAILAPDGVWVVQMAYLGTMLETNGVDNICHEHVTYYSIATLERVLETASLELVHLEFNDVNGGSLRAYIQHPGVRRQSGTVEAARVQENALGLNTRAPLGTFVSRILAAREALGNLLTELESAGKRIHVYGASTKGNTLLQFLGVGWPQIQCASERCPQKWGTVALGSGLPVIAEAESRKMSPDYYLVLPWHFERSFLEREREYLEGGGKMIFPLPQVRIASIRAGQIVTDYV